MQTAVLSYFLMFIIFCIYLCSRLYFVATIFNAFCIYIFKLQLYYKVLSVRKLIILHQYGQIKIPIPHYTKIDHLSLLSNDWFRAIIIISKVKFNIKYNHMYDTAGSQTHDPLSQSILTQHLISYTVMNRIFHYAL